MIAQESDDGLTLTIKVLPRSKREAFAGEQDGALKIALTAPPVDGAANEALIAFLAKSFGVAKRKVTIVRGETSRQKVVCIAGATLADLTRVLPVR